MDVKRLMGAAVFAAVLFSACSVGEANISQGPSASMSLDQPAASERTPPSDSPSASLYSTVYAEPQSGYTIISSDLLDTLFIAGALYYDFESNNLCPARSRSHNYSDVREHFAPYKTHPFIEELGKYVNDMTRDVNGDAVWPLVYHILTGEGLDQWSSSLFADTAEANLFIDDLKQFYQDTEAEEFLRSNSLRNEMLAYLPDAAQGISIERYLREMEAYIGSKDPVHGGASPNYYCLITPFRPAMASFYACDLGEDIYFVSQAAPYSLMDGTLDIRQLVETSVHESLHLFINSAIADKSEWIEALARDRNPADFTSPMYADLPWNRIVDEAVARAIQAGIYRQVYRDSDRAYEELLVKEGNAGIVNLDGMYEALSTYEADRDTYPTIYSFMDILIQNYLLPPDAD